MLRSTAAVPEPTVQTRPAQLLLLVVGRECDAIDRAFDDETEVTVESVPELENARPRLDDIDCLVVQSPTTATDGTEDRGESGERTDDTTGDKPTDDGSANDVADSLETIRTDAPELPVVVLADELAPTLTRAVRSDGWTAVAERDETLALLADRVHDLLERRRLTTLARRSLASVEFAGDAIAIVDPDGDVQFASRSFAMQFGSDRDDLAGTPWRELFTDAAVSHLESAALPTIAEGWRWTGSCTGRRQTGATFPARVRLGGLEDGSLVFVVDESEGSDGLEE
ncbi:PAS domain-containing protein [Natrinema sp. DC36]|uniref:PAS domain-containing protein n=1 Tax=Natrinema sp. DC36 TaxID=2878680 RepID=UPI001CF0A3CB|nr:PAS domain-containing protein [Natrinema sp. DC36]